MRRGGTTPVVNFQIFSYFDILFQVRSGARTGEFVLETLRFFGLVFNLKLVRAWFSRVPGLISKQAMCFTVARCAHSLRREFKTDYVFHCRSVFS